MKQIPCIVVMLLSLLNATSQTTRLKPGDKCPDVVLSSLQKPSVLKSKLSEYKGRLIILDFFSPYCGTCIRELKRLNEMQQQANDKVRIIIVSEGSLTDAREFFANNKWGMANKLPVVTGNKQLSALFPHKLYPHEVWIDSDRTVRAITGVSEVTYNNIIALINNKYLGLPLKRDIMDFDEKKLLLEDGNGGDINSILFRSTITKYIDGLGSKSAVFTDSLFKHYLTLNRPLLALYEESLGGLLENHIVLDVKDSSRFITQDNNDWYANNLYCYELCIPSPTSFEAMRERMRTDIENYFGLTGKFEKRKMDCYAVVMLNNSDSLIKSKTDKPYISFSNDDSLKQLIHQPLSLLTEELNNLSTSSHAIFIDKTGYTGLVDLSFSINNTEDIPALQKALAHYGLGLVRETEEMEVFVITEKEASRK